MYKIYWGCFHTQIHFKHIIALIKVKSVSLLPRKMCPAHWQWSHTAEDGHIVHIGLTLAHVPTDTADQCSG